MSNKSTLFIDGVQVTEMAGSGRVSYGKNGSISGTRIFLVPWNNRTDVVRSILGNVELSENNSINVLPGMNFSVDKDPDLYASTIEQTPFDGLAKEDSNKEIEYKYSILTVKYEPRDNQTIETKNSNGTTKTTGDSSSSVLMTVKISSSVENITIPNSEKNWNFLESDGVGYGFNTKKTGTVKTGSVSKVVPFLNWTLIYKKIPDIQISKIRKSLSNPLHSTVESLSNRDGIQKTDVKGLGRVRRGTMLFLGFDATQDSVLLQGAKKASKKAWSISFKFKEHPFGWNYIYTGQKDTKSPIGSLPSFGWIPIRSKDGETLYSNSDFNNFLPDIKELK